MRHGALKLQKVEQSSRLYVLVMFAVVFFTASGVYAQNDSMRPGVVRDSPGSQNIKGSVVLVPVRSSQTGSDNTNILKGLSEGIIKYTDINTSIDQSINFDSPRLLKYPFVYLNTGQGFELLDSEKANLKNYLSSGGFIVLEFDYKAFSGLKKNLPENARLKQIPPDHKIYRSFFNIEQSIFDGDMGERRSGQLMTGPYLTGIWLDDVLVGIYSDKKLGNEWERYWERRTGDGSRMRLGVNLVVYALSR
ncbi:DUF4159 domain-containing protein [bacterium]|nr:DUF4159 domain-containing protein [bacterium]